MDKRRITVIAVAGAILLVAAVLGILYFSFLSRSTAKVVLPDTENTGGQHSRDSAGYRGCPEAPGELPSSGAGYSLVQRRRYDGDGESVGYGLDELRRHRAAGQHHKEHSYRRRESVYLVQ